MMPWLVSVVLAIAVVGFAVREVRFRRAQKSTPAFRPGLYASAPSLFSPAEQSFLDILVGLGLPGMRVLAKVHLASLFRIRRPNPALGWEGDDGAIARAQVDFLLVRIEDGRPVLGINFDDFSDQRPERVTRDGRIRALFAECGLPLLSLPAKQAYTPALVRRLIYDIAPLNFPLSGIAEKLATALQPST